MGNNSEKFKTDFEKAKSLQDMDFAVRYLSLGEKRNLICSLKTCRWYVGVTIRNEMLITVLQRHLDRES